jgi:toxin ParE1/3/4
MARVRITVLAQEDLDSIWSFVAKESIASADRVIDRIHGACTTFAAYPDAATPADRFQSGLRCFAVGSFVVFCKPHDDGLLVVRVLHGARNLDDLFS